MPMDVCVLQNHVTNIFTQENTTANVKMYSLL